MLTQSNNKVKMIGERYFECTGVSLASHSRSSTYNVLSRAKHCRQNVFRTSVNAKAVCSRCFDLSLLSGTGDQERKMGCRAQDTSKNIYNHSRTETFHSKLSSILRSI